MMYAFGFKRRQQRVGCVSTSEYTKPLSVKVHDGKTPKLQVDVDSTKYANSSSPLIDSGYPSTALSSKFPTQLPTIHEDTNHTILDALPRISEALTSIIPHSDIPVVMQVLTQAFQTGNVGKLPANSENLKSSPERESDEISIVKQPHIIRPIHKSVTAPNLKRYTKSSIAGEDDGLKSTSKSRGTKKSGSKLKALVLDWLSGNRSTIRPTTSKSERELPVLRDEELLPTQSIELENESSKDSIQIQRSYPESIPHKDGARKVHQLPAATFSAASDGGQKRHSVQIASNLERKSSLAARTRKAVTLVKSKSLRRTRSCASRIAPSRRISQLDSIKELVPSHSPKPSPKTHVQNALTRANTVIGVRQYAIARQPLKQYMKSSHSLELQEQNRDNAGNAETNALTCDSNISPAMSLSEIQSPQKQQPRVMRKPVSVTDDLGKILANKTTNQSMPGSEGSKDGQSKSSQSVSESDYLKRDQVYSFPDASFSENSDDDTDSMRCEDLMGEPIKPGMVKSSKTESQIASQEAPPYINISASQAVASFMGNAASKPSLKSLVKSNSTSSLLTVDATISKGNVDLTVKCVADVIYEIICNNHAALRFSSNSVLLYREASHKGLYGIVPFTKWRQVHEQLAYVFECGELRAECAIITLIYIKRMLKSSEIDLYDGNWRLTVLGALLLAVKVWDDCAVYNIDFISLFPEIGVRYMNTLERFFIRALNYDVSIKSSLFATEYFKLRGRAMTQKIQDHVSHHSTGTKSQRGNRTVFNEMNNTSDITLMQEEDQSSHGQSLTQRFDSTKLLSAKQADKLDACSDRCGWKQSETMHDLSKLATTANEPSQLLITSATMGPYGGVGGNIFDNVDDFRKCNSDLAFVALGKAIIN